MEKARTKERDVTLLNGRIHRALLNQRFDRALCDVRLAQAELVLAVHQLTPLAVGDKQLITRGVAGSFEKLRTARRSVADLQLMLMRAMPV
jgi:hypothetical protein